MGKASRRKKGKDKKKTPGTGKVSMTAPSPQVKDTFAVPFLHAAFIAAMTFLVYFGSFEVPFQFDDLPNIQHNEIIRDLDHFIDPSSAEGMQFYNSVQRRFIGYLSFALDYAVHGLDVTGYHVTNLLIHIINAIFVYMLVLFTFRTPVMRAGPEERPDEGIHRLIALFASLLFAVHPIQTQAVTYIVQRFASLATLFSLGALLCYVRFRLAKTPRKGLVYYGLAIGSAVLGVKTKEIVFTVPVMIGVYELMFFRGELKKRLLALAPFALPMVLVPMMVLGAKEGMGNILAGLTESTRVQTEMSRWDYLLTQFRVVVTYIRLLFVPVGQNLDYDYPVYHSLFDPAVLASFLFLLTLFGGGVYLWYRNRRSERVRPYQMLISFGVIWFFVTLSVESSVIPIKDVIFEHRVYLPSFGAFAVVGGVVLWVVQKRPGMLRKVMVVCGLIVIILAGATYARNKVWESELSLWEDVVKKSPDKARGYNNLGTWYDRKGMPDKAVTLYEKAIDIQSDYAEAFYNLGVISTKKGDLSDAIGKFQKTIAIDPGYTAAYYNLGVILSKNGRKDEAGDLYEKAIASDPGFAPAYYNLGLLSERKSDSEEALEYYQKAVKLDPDMSDAWFRMGSIVFDRNDYEKAVEYYQHSIKSGRDDPKAFGMIGISYHRMKDYARAIESLDRAIELAPSVYQYRMDKGLVHAEQGNFEKAVREFTEVLKMSPGFYDALLARGGAYRMMKKNQLAERDLKRACSLGNIRACDMLKRSDSQ